jgi:hypothetical protein
MGEKLQWKSTQQLSGTDIQKLRDGLAMITPDDILLANSTIRGSIAATNANASVYILKDATYNKEYSIKKVSYDVFCNVANDWLLPFLCRNLDIYYNLTLLTHQQEVIALTEFVTIHRNFLVQTPDGKLPWVKGLVSKPAKYAPNFLSKCAELENPQITLSNKMITDVWLGNFVPMLISLSLVEKDIFGDEFGGVVTNGGKKIKRAATPERYC